MINFVERDREDDNIIARQEERIDFRFYYRKTMKIGKH